MTPPHKDNLFKWKQFPEDIILLAVRWYCQFALTYRDLVIIMAERGVSISHTTMMRWVHQAGPEIKKRMKKFLKKSNDSYRIDETYVKVKGFWIYLYRAVDSAGNTLDWMLSETRNQEAAEKFFKQTLQNDHCTPPRVMGVDKNAAYPPAFKALQKEGVISKETELRQNKYLNNIIEQDHRSTKKKLRYSQWLQSFETADATISGYESMHMIKKGQIKDVGSKDFMAQKKFIESLFGVAA